jgi:hypothetical protein
MDFTWSIQMLHYIQYIWQQTTLLIFLKKQELKKKSSWTVYLTPFFMLPVLQIKPFHY